MTRKRTRRIWYLVLLGFVALTLVSGLIALQPYGTPLDRLVRGTAALGYLAIFLAIISSAYMRQLVRFFGRPFIQLHHILSVTGLVMVTLHPLGRLSNVVGRDPRCDVVIEHPNVSHEHLRIVWRKGQPGVEELGSKNGTKVDDVADAEGSPHVFPL